MGGPSAQARHGTCAIGLPTPAAHRSATATLPTRHRTHLHTVRKGRLAAVADATTLRRRRAQSLHSASRGSGANTNERPHL